MFTPISYFLVRNYANKKSIKSLIIYGPRLKSFSFNKFLRIGYYPFILITLFPIILLLSRFKFIKIWLPHNGSRILKLINKYCSVNHFVDDGMSAITGIKASLSNYKPNYLLTFSDYKFHISDYNFVQSASIHEYLLVLKRFKNECLNPNKFNTDVCVIQSYAINKSIWNDLIKRYNSFNITCFLHPFEFKNKDVPKSIKNLVPAIPESLDCYLYDLQSFKEIYIGRSFTTIALLNASKLHNTNINICLNTCVDLLDEKFYIYLKKNFYRNINIKFHIS